MMIGSFNYETYLYNCSFARFRRWIRCGSTCFVPGCVTYGHTLSEALVMVEDAIEGYLSVLQEDGDPLPMELNI
jgi:predicted RNase H-like HicB family nuclease